MGTTDLITTSHRRSSYFTGCMSPSCIPVQEEYKRINSGGTRGRSQKKWKKLINKVVKEGKKMGIYGGSSAAAAKTLTFHYDAVSYSQNFDDGNHLDDEYYQYGRWCSQALPECA